MGYEGASQRKTSLQCNCYVNKKLLSLKINRGALQQNEPHTRCTEKPGSVLWPQYAVTVCISIWWFSCVLIVRMNTNENLLCRKSPRCPWIQHLNRLLEYFSAVCVVSLTLGAAYKACVMVEEVSCLVEFGKSDPGKGHFMSVWACNWKSAKKYFVICHCMTKDEYTGPSAEWKWQHIYAPEVRTLHSVRPVPCGWGVTSTKGLQTLPPLRSTAA